MKTDTSMMKETSEAVEKDRELTLQDLEAVSGGAFDAFLRIPESIHALNPQPLPPG